MTMLYENIRLALFSLKANKMRALLTMLGIIIGISSVITIVSLGSGLKEDVMSSNETKSVTVNTPCIKVYMLKKSVSINPKTYDALDSVTRHANRSGKAKKKS